MQRSLPTGNVEKSFRRPQPADLLHVAKKRFLEGRLENLEQLADELGISRATAYKWVGNVAQMMSLIFASIAEEMFQRASDEIKGSGVTRIQKILMRISRETVTLAPYRRFIENNPEKALRIITAKGMPLQKKSITLIEGLLEQETAKGQLALPLDAHTMAYVLARVIESFVYADFLADEPADFEKEAVVLATLLKSGEVRETSLARRGKPGSPNTTKN